MERLPLFIAVASFLAWALTALFMNGTLKSAARGIGLGLALIQLGCSAWATARVFGDEAVQYGGTWFSFGTGLVFEVRFALDGQGAVFWLALSVFAAILGYFALMRQLSEKGAPLRGEAVSIPLLGLGALCAITSSNFLSFLFGWSLVAVAGFLAIGFSAPNRDERASAALRYLALNMFPEAVFVAGMLGCYVSYGSLSFAALNEKGLVDGSGWAVMCLVVGMMLRNLQIPLMQTARYLTAARASAIPVLFIGHALLSATLFAKLHPAIIATEGMQYVAIVPALTAIMAAALALAEDDAFLFIGWLVSYLCAGVFLSGLAGHYQAAQALALTGAVAAFLLAVALSEPPEGDSSVKWFAGIAMAALTGVPLSGWGWARYLEYVGLFQNEGQVPLLHWFFLVLKILADIMMGIALWGVVRERWLSREKRPRVQWETAVPLVVPTVACLAVTIGGRFLSGLAGQVELDAFAGAAWFERLLSPPPGAAKGPAAAIELLASDADFFARFTEAGAFLLPALLAGLWLFRDKRALDEFRAGCRRIIARLSRGDGRDPLLWRWIVRPVSTNLGRVASAFDRDVLDYVMGDMWATPARFVRDAFIIIEDRILDRSLIDGLAEAFASVGKSLRLVQNGQVQFYFALGLILMGGVVIRFVGWGGLGR